MKRIMILVLLISMMLVSCNMQPEADAGNAAAPQEEGNVEEAPAEEAQAPAEEAAEESTAEDTMELSLSTDPVEVTFTAADGFELNGMYYPSVYMNAPVVVLMHQANMNMHQWDTIAIWLQNAGGEQAGVSPVHVAKLLQTEPWQDDSWFPAMPEGFSVSVFIFTFRGCENGCSTFDRDGWVLDATAALEKAASMPEVDPSRVVPFGTSIGADGAVDGCISLSEDSPVNCLNGFSLSPGSYLNIEYPTAVETAIEMGKNQNCFATFGDSTSALTCGKIDSEGYASFVEKGYEHGIEMINPDFSTNILEMLRDYLVNEVL